MSDHGLHAQEAEVRGGMMEPVQLQSEHTMTETVARRKQALSRRSLHLVVDIDHSAGAAKVQLQMPPTRLLIFGNANTGTPMMLCSPAAAIDLPLKVLVREEGSAAWLSYDKRDYLQLRHGIPDNLLDKLRGISAICEEAAGREQ